MDTHLDPLRCLHPLRAAIPATFLALSPLARAEADLQEPIHGFSGRIGLAVAAVPTYEGSPYDRMLAGPDLTLRYRSRDWGSLELGQRGLVWDAVESGPLRLALVAQFDLGRKDRDTSTLNPASGDERLAGMGTVHASTEAGIGIGYGPVMVVARQSLGGRGSGGAQVDMTVGFPWAVSDRLDLRFALGATWASREYLQTWFGVTDAQARSSSFSAYTPGSGCRKVEASLAAEYTLASGWKLQAIAGFSQLGDPAAASPLVERRNAASVVLGLAHEF